MRYLGQNYELEIPIEAEEFTDEEVSRVFDSFHEQHRARFGFRLDDHVELVNFLVTGIARTGEMTLPEIEASMSPCEPKTRRPVWFAGGWSDTPVYWRPDLRAGDRIAGPALVEEDASVTVLDPGKTLEVDKFGNLLIAA